MTALRLSVIDCESAEDFYQYYRGRWFVFEERDGTRIPGMLSQIDGSQLHITKLTALGAPSEMVCEHWNNVSKKGQFGLPVLGNTQLRDTYTYLWSFARRESVKGLGYEKLSAWVPDPYGLGQELLRRADHNAISHSWRKLETIWNIYNPRYFKFNEAVEALDSGERVGCQLSVNVGLHLAKSCPKICVSSRMRTVGILNTPKQVVMLAGFGHLADVVKLALPSDIQIITN